MTSKEGTAAILLDSGLRWELVGGLLTGNW